MNLAIHISTLCGQKVKFLDVKTCCTIVNIGQFNIRQKQNFIKKNNWNTFKYQSEDDL